VIIGRILRSLAISLRPDPIPLGAIHLCRKIVHTVNGGEAALEQLGFFILKMGRGIKIDKSAGEILLAIKLLPTGYLQTTGILNEIKGNDFS
jgi:hypothetical protein